MASNYKFSNAEMAAIKAARRETKDKRADARLKALELRAEGMELSEVSHGRITSSFSYWIELVVTEIREANFLKFSGSLEE